VEPVVLRYFLHDTHEKRPDIGPYPTAKMAEFMSRTYEVVYKDASFIVVEKEVEPVKND
jgi:hypothetical protein